MRGKMQYRRSLFFALIAAIILSPLLMITATNAASPAGPAGWNNVFIDEFNGPSGSGIDTSKWKYDIGTSYPGGPANWGTEEIQTYTSSRSNVYLDGNGHLVIKAIREAKGKWSSGRIETVSDQFKPDAGGILRVEASIKLPALTGKAAKGYWSAFWMLGAPYRDDYDNWPKTGEIDILENVNGENTVYGTLHCGTSPGGPCNEKLGLGGSKSGFMPTMQNAFHTYAVEFDRSVQPEQIRWYADGVNYFTLSADRVDAATWNNATQNGWFILLNLAVGGMWPGDPTASTVSGGKLTVDYVSAWVKPAPAKPQSIISGATYELLNPNSGKALDVSGAGKVNGTNVQIWTRNGTGAQVWKIIKNTDGTYRLINPNSGKALDVSGAGTEDGTNVQIWTDNRTAAQKWRILPNSDGTFTLVNPKSGKALDVYSANTADGTNVHIWTQNSTVAQQWELKRVN